MKTTTEGSATDPTKASNQSQDGTSNASSLPHFTDLCSATPLADWRGDLALFDGLYATLPSKIHTALNWNDFSKEICPDEPIVVGDKRDAPYFLPCQLHEAPLTGQTLARARQNGEPSIGKMRSKDHVTESNVLLFDYDRIEEQEFERIRSFLEGTNLTYLAYTTFSHGQEDKPGMRIRLCMPVDRPLDAVAYTAAWQRFAALLPVVPDTTGSKLCQQQGTWVCHQDRLDKADRWSNDAGVLSVKPLMSHAIQDKSAPQPSAPNPEHSCSIPEYPLSDPNLVADRCKQIREFRDTKGANQTEPLWRDSIGVVGHCQNGKVTSQAWSSGHPGYSEAETDRKLDHRLTVGPTTCEKFRSTNPDGCTGCQEKVKSPIMLGIQRQGQSTSQPTQVDGGSPFHPVAVYSEPIDPKQLFEEVVEILTRFVIMDKHQLDASAFWAIQSWLIESAQVAPLLLITAAERESGKTQLLTVASMLCRHPMTVANSTAAFLFRAISKWQPTLFIDEVDTFMRDSTDQKGLINAGHTRESAWVGRVVGDTHEPTMFPVFCPKALSGINLAKHLPDSTMSRGILITLRRKLPDEKCERLRFADRGQFKLLQSKLARFAQDYAERISNTRPTLPDALSDRQQDNWEPLFAIAACAGPEWLARCEAAALALSRSASPAEDTGNNLLDDIRDIFHAKKCDRISSADLIDALTMDDEAGWSTYNRGKPLTPRQVAKLLKPYGIIPKTVRLANFNTPKGYDRAQFEDAFTRYLPAPERPDNPPPEPADTLTPDPAPTQDAPPDEPELAF